MNIELFLSLVLAHVVGDFYLQNDKYCKQKAEKKVKSWFLYVHSFIIGAISWLMVPSCDFWLCSLIIVFSHLIIDIVKVYSRDGLRSFVIDQLLHIGILAAIATMFNVEKALPIQMIDCSETFSVLALCLALLLCWRPANILIKLILEKYQVKESVCDSMKNAGALIGNLERTLTIIFVIIGQYEAIGFIIAAKSILRFKDTDTAKTEYVLVGTFLSFSIAIVFGLLCMTIDLGS